MGHSLLQNLWSMTFVLLMDSSKGVSPWAVSGMTMPHSVLAAVDQGRHSWPTLAMSEEYLETPERMPAVCPDRLSRGGGGSQ